MKVKEIHDKERLLSKQGGIESRQEVALIGGNYHYSRGKREDSQVKHKESQE